ncbi:hypothetical protein LSH36_147g01007 [Paralvinella palmiformis]|uniref:Uncharacterized protein n=1 Tax=Paralvinella palmiformis TaxID=53620 RepID=A0AAD9JUU0_9ANNE|nr:hypothetical protein LSH36_147g01007 [Paralvinella palmiformis]
MPFTEGFLSYLVLISKYACINLIRPRYLSVRFAEQSLIPDPKSSLTDDSANTCAKFSIGENAQIPLSSHFRIQLPPDKGYPITVSLTGHNLKCGGSFYVTLISSAETKTWIGRWSTFFLQCSKYPLTGVHKFNLGTQHKCEFRDVYCDMETDGGLDGFVETEGWIRRFH